MRSSIAVATILAMSFGFGNGECANQCSGHGSCGLDDICSCYKMWNGADCSARKCPSRIAWGDVKDSSVTGRSEHYYAECANRGKCDGETGQCQCDDGFEGEGCERMTCPNDCSGHGTCETMSSVNSGYTSWDASKVQLCVCDPGYEGHDCVDRKCKLGDDPISRFDSGGAAEVDEIQQLRIQSSGTFDAGSFFTLKYTDWRGNTWVSRPIETLKTSVIAIKEALLTLPMRSIDDITVAETTASTSDRDYLVTFTSLETPGSQPQITIDVAGCVLHGCQPVFTATTGGTITVTNTKQTTGTGQRAVCANRGKCNAEIGECECFNGFYGHACEKQTLVL